MKRLLTLAILSAVGLISSTLSATPMGSLNEANCSGGGIEVNLSSITFLPVGPSAGTGCIVTGTGTSLNFTGGTISSGVTGTIKNLTFGGGPVDNFITFASAPSVDFMLTLLGPGAVNTVCAGLGIGQSCSVAAGSPFVLTNLGGNNTTVSLSTNGIVKDSTGQSAFTGAFTTQLNLSPDAIQTRVLANQTISSTQSAQFTLTAVPEPGTMSMLMAGAGLLIVGLKRRKA